jgi:hypothetical protein
LYALRRTHDLNGVSIPSQRRCVVKQNTAEPSVACPAYMPVSSRCRCM